MKRTPLYDEHVKAAAKMVEFGGWEMPLNFPTGIISEHLATRKSGGLFDISHMGRFMVSGENAIPFLQYVLTNNAEALKPCESQYTIIPNENGGAVDDAYLYRLDEYEFLLVVNAANTEKDWDWLKNHIRKFGKVTLEDKTSEIVMLSLQGPKSKEILGRILGDERKLPEPTKNTLVETKIMGARVHVSRTGYTGEPLGFELFPPAEIAVELYRKILEYSKEAGIVPVGLGARDTLRLEAGLPLYGHELGSDVSGKEIPIFALPAAKIAVSFAEVKGDFIGCDRLRCQFEEVKMRQEGLTHTIDEKSLVPKTIMPVVLSGGIARSGYPVSVNSRPTGNVTSGTAVPYWDFEEGTAGKPAASSKTRAICLTYALSSLKERQKVTVQIRDRAVEGVVVKRFLSGQAPPYARPVFA